MSAQLANLWQIGKNPGRNGAWILWRPRSAIDPRAEVMTGPAGRVRCFRSYEAAYTLATRLARGDVS